MFSHHTCVCFMLEYDWLLFVMSKNHARRYASRSQTEVSENTLLGSNSARPCSQKKQYTSFKWSSTLNVWKENVKLSKKHKQNKTKQKPSRERALSQRAPIVCAASYLGQVSENSVVLVVAAVFLPTSSSETKESELWETPKTNMRSLI